MPYLRKQEFCIYIGSETRYSLLALRQADTMALIKNGNIAWLPWGAEAIVPVGLYGFV
jgi:hypothetical protein